MEALRAETAKREQKTHTRSKKRISYAKDDEEKPCEKSKKRQKTKQETVIRRGKSSTSNDDTPCSTCAEQFCDDNSGSEWTQCQQCKRWFHNACQGYQKRRSARLLVLSALTKFCRYCYNGIVLHY